MTQVIWLILFSRSSFAILSRSHGKNRARWDGCLTEEYEYDISFAIVSGFDGNGNLWVNLLSNDTNPRLYTAAKAGQMDVLASLGSQLQGKSVSAKRKRHGNLKYHK
jgi:hypothetical protein